jgi:hypothetical protein
MSNAGKSIIKKDKIRILSNGKIAVFNAAGECNPCCICCKPETVAERTMEVYGDASTWDLTPYQGNGIGALECPDQYWRLINNYMSYVPERKGCVDSNGKLTGLPSSISSTSYKYTWVFKLQIGCLNPKNKSQIQWPDGSTSSVFNC